MSIFGQLDADSIPDNPFWVEAGEYRAMITSAFFDYNKSREQDVLVIVYTIVDKSSKYFNKEVRDWFDYYPNLTPAEYAEMVPTEQAKVDRALSAIKRRLCGNPKKERYGLGVSADNLNSDWEPKSLVNTEVDLVVVNGGDDNEFTNVKWVEKV